MSESQKITSSENPPQVDKTHYDFRTYSSERRFISYHHQIQNVMNLVERFGARKVLVAGIGDGAVPLLLKNYSRLLDLDLEVDTFDFAADLFPDHLGDLAHIKDHIKRNYDVILCCQVLEHLPYQDAIQAIMGMGDIAKYLILSVPYFAFTIRGNLKLPVLPELDFCIKIPLINTKTGMVDDRHYWELGRQVTVKGFLHQVRSLNFDIISSHILKKDGYKFFVILESKRQDRVYEA